MDQVTKLTVKKLQQFFTAQPSWFRVCIARPSEVMLWEAIFQHFFQTPPFDTEVVTYPLERRAGSADPRWDVLFFEHNALKAQAIIIAHWHSQFSNQIQVQEAA